MPLTEPVEFKTILQIGDRVQVPRLVRWKYKLESTQTLKVAVWVAGVIGGWEAFYARMDKSGRITVSRLVRDMLAGRKDERQRLVGAVLEVRLEPV